MELMDLKGKWVLVTGASAGLGQELARQLAFKHGANLVITARRAQRLEELKAELEQKAGVQVVPLTGDMADHVDVERLTKQVTEGRQIYAAILNAGVTHFGHHHELDWDDFQNMLQVNVTANVFMCSALVQHMEAHQLGGGIMLVSSLAGMTPVPYQSAYSGTKAFLVQYGTALSHELEGKPVSIGVFAPGGIQTEMTAKENFGPLQKWLAPVEEVAREGIAALRSRERLAVPGFLNRLGVFAFRFLPRGLVVGQLGATYRKALAETSAKQPAAR